MKKMGLGFISILCCSILAGCNAPPRDKDNLLIGDWSCSYKINYREEVLSILSNSGWGRYEFREEDKVTVEIDDFRGIGTYTFNGNLITITVGEYVQHQWQITQISEDENQFLAVENTKNYTCSRFN